MPEGSTSPEFAETVRDAMRSLQFFAAELNGERIAQVVQMSFAFTYEHEPLDGDVVIYTRRR